MGDYFIRISPSALSLTIAKPSAFKFNSGKTDDGADIDICALEMSSDVLHTDEEQTLCSSQDFVISHSTSL